jgi:hypothetical protein
LSAHEFAERIDVKEATLRHWAWQLSHEARTAMRQSAFVEVVAPRSSEPIEIVVHDGIRIRVSNEFDEALLRRVVSALESR